jgi:hypothetical protein
MNNQISQRNPIAGAAWNYACSGIFCKRFADMAKPAGEDMPRPLRWVGGSRDDVSDFPEEVRRRIGGCVVGSPDRPQGALREAA